MAERAVIRRLLLLVTCVGYLYGTEPDSFKAPVRLPLAFITPEGVRIGPGRSDVEVRFEQGRWWLRFAESGQLRCSVAALPAGAGAAEAKAVVPLIGTQYLRPSDEPVGTDEERHFSQTGKAQYEEERRAWRATLRIYATSGRNARDAYAVFVYYRPGKAHVQQEFKLLLDARE
jgi:hypothetical protein